MGCGSSGPGSSAAAKSKMSWLKNASPVLVGVVEVDAFWRVLPTGTPTRWQSTGEVVPELEEQDEELAVRRGEGEPRGVESMTMRRRRSASRRRLRWRRSPAAASARTGRSR